MKILVNGSVAYDVLLSHDGAFLDNLNTQAKDALSVIYLTSHYARHHGGTAPNIAWNLNLLGKDPLPVATLGSDGGEYIALLQDRGINVTYLEKIEDDVCSTAIIGSDSKEHQIGFFHPGADAKGSFPDITDERDAISYAIISPRDERVMIASINWCKEFKVPYLFDPGQRITSFADDDLRRSIQGAYALVCNEYEWSVISTRLNLNEKNIFELTESLIVTLSDKGAAWHTKDEVIEVGGCTAEKVVNPTGAGDALRSGVLAGLDSSWEKRDCLRLGCAMGSFAVEIQGTLIDHIDKEEVWQRAEEAYGEVLPVL